MVKAGAFGGRARALGDLLLDVRVRPVGGGNDINGDLALIVAAAELIKLNPDLLPRMLTTLSEQPPKIRDRADKFSAAFEKMLGITHP